MTKNLELKCVISELSSIKEERSKYSFKSPTSIESGVTDSYLFIFSDLLYKTLLRKPIMGNTVGSRIGPRRLVGCIMIAIAILEVQSAFIPSAIHQNLRALIFFVIPELW